MSDVTECPNRTDPETISRYVAGTLSAGDIAGFELHMLECSVCVRAVNEAAAIASAVRRSTGAGRAAPVRIAHRPSRRAAFILIPLAAVAAIVFLVGPRAGDFSNLAGFAPPVFEPLDVRAARGGGAELATAGMNAYARGDYAAAAQQLEEAARRLPAPGTFFFLGISQLMMNESERASESLLAALRPPGNPYAAESHYYLAKAQLRRNRPDSALVHLRQVTNDGTPLAIHAQALADSVQARIAQ